MAKVITAEKQYKARVVTIYVVMLILVGVQ
jgi:hypothetical protein